MADLDKTATSEWISRRANAVRAVYTAYNCVCENGHGEQLTDDSTPVQIPCFFHGADNKPSARYYPRTGVRSDYVRCFKCRENWDCVNLYAKFKGLRFMDALAALERRFSIKVLRRPEGPDIVAPADRGAAYVSAEWRDVPRVLAMMERRVLLVRDRCGMSDYVKFCRVLDVVQYDFDKVGKGTPEMVAVLHRLKDRVDEVVDLAEAMRDFEDAADPVPPV
jgi:hypothetical protein